MVLSYSAMARATEGAPQVISIATQPSVTPLVPADQPSSSGPSTESVSSPTSSAQPLPSGSSASQTSAPASASASGSGSGSSSNATIQHLILDAGPLLSLTPLRHLATTFHTTPMVLAELRDPKAREHWERLGLAGVDVRVEPPTAEAMAKVIAFAKKTGDFAVLSQTDLSVAALTYQYEVIVNGEDGIRTEPGQKIKKKSTIEETTETSETQESQQQQDDAADVDDESAEEDQAQDDVEEVTRSIDQVLLDFDKPSEAGDAQAAQPAESTLPISTFKDVELPSPSIPEPAAIEHAQDIDNESDGGEWITPSNLTNHRSRDLGLITPSGPSAAKPPSVACMTGDYAVQNILLGMGLGLIGEGGKKISKVKSWVLRCHACFKICKDPSKRFCPSCGNATLLRTTVSTDSKTGQQSVHLKKNFQYHTRGTKYSIPDAKMGRAKGQLKGGSGLVLREDQMEWTDAVRQQDRQRVKEEKRAAKGALEGWNDPDWLPEIITVGMSGKGRSSGQGMPTIGHGRKNPNQARRKR